MNTIPLIVVFCHLALGLKTYKSSLPLSDKDAIAGIQLLPDSIKKSSDFSSGLTICSSFNYRHLDAWNSAMFDIHNGPLNLAFLSMGYEKSLLYFADHLTILKDVQKNTFQVWTPQVWHHLCLSFDTRTSILRMIKDGNLTNIDKSIEVDAKYLSSDFLKSVMFGKKRDDAKGHSRHSGMISNINIWDRPLKLKDMLEWTSCKANYLKGNIVDWTTSNWTVTNMDEVDMELCPSSTSELILVPEFTAQAAVQFCWKLRGELFLLEDQASYDLAKKLTNQDQRLWTGWWDKPRENEFIDMTGKGFRFNITRFSNNRIWLKSEPNGDRIENCIGASKDGFYDKTCKDQARMWSLCQLQELPIFRLRGLCHKAGFDTDYAWTGELTKKDRFTFQGFSKSFISYDAGAEMWKLSDISSSEIFATTYGTDKYPLGKNLWIFNKKLCGEDEQYLSLSACPREGIISTAMTDHGRY